MQAAQTMGLDGMIQKEFVNGELSGIRLFLAMPELIITDFEDQVTEIREEIEDGDSSDTTNAGS